jgi:hypothetical protein
MSLQRLCPGVVSSLLYLVAALNVVYASDPKWWLFDRSEQGTKVADVRRACSIAFTEGSVALRYEAYNGMLGTYFESSNPKTIEQMKQQLKSAPGLCVRCDDESYVMLSAVVRVDSVREGEREKYELHGYTCVLGTVSDPATVKRFKDLIKAR